MPSHPGTTSPKQIHPTPHLHQPRARASPNGKELKSPSTDKLSPLNHTNNTPPPTQPAIPSCLTISGTFHSLFKVLFIFPSQYFFAIGLWFYI